LLIVIPALRITVKPTLGNHPFVKLKVIAQNRWLLNEGYLLGQLLSLLWVCDYCQFVIQDCRVQTKRSAIPL